MSKPTLSDTLRVLEEAIEIGDADEIAAAKVGLWAAADGSPDAAIVRDAVGALTKLLGAEPLDRPGGAAVCTTLREVLEGRTSATLQVATPEPDVDAGGWSVAADMAEMLRDFGQEAYELLDKTESACLSLDTELTQEGIALAFRAFHTIKGVAGFLELKVLAELAHHIESVLSDVRDGAPPPSGFVDLVLRAVDLARGCIAVAMRGGGGERPDVAAFVATLTAVAAATAAGAGASSSSPIAILAAVALGPAPVAPPVAAPPLAFVAAAPPLPTPSEKSAFTAMALAPIAADAGRAPELDRTRAIKVVKADDDEVAAIRVDIGKMDHIIDLVGELAIAQAQVAAHPELSQLAGNTLTRAISRVGRVVRDLQRASLAMRMVTIKGTFERMARVARDTARNVGKPIAFAVEGAQTELDRTIVDAIYDPLVHLVRNAIDHGLEGRIERVRRGKPEAGSITLRAYHQAGYIVVEIADDGGGLDRTKILARARSRGLVPADATPPDAEIDQMIFLPGFSTAEKVTSVSGRGVGMDVVRTNVEKVRGRVEITSVLGKGTTFRLKLPLTLAIIDGIVLGLGEDRFILPASWVRDLFRPTPEQILTVQGRGEMVQVRGALYPLRRLANDLGAGDPCLDPSKGVVVMVDDGVRPVGLLADRLLGKQEVVVKSLGPMFTQIAGVAGGAILGDGRIALILDVPTLVGARAQVA